MAAKRRNAGRAATAGGGKICLNRDLADFTDFSDFLNGIKKIN